jgi:hypothetical protein
MRDDVFRAARDYHAALAAYSRAMCSGGDLEDLAQQVVGTSLRYRRALDLQLAENPYDPVWRRRAAAVRKLLHSTSVNYNLAKRIERSQQEDATLSE